MTFAITAVTCRDVTCESIPGSPHPFSFFVGARGEPGNDGGVCGCMLCKRKRRERVVHYLTTISLLEMCLGNSDTTYPFSLQIQGGIMWTM